MADTNSYDSEASEVTITPDLDGFSIPPLDALDSQGENRGPTLMAQIKAKMFSIGLLALAAMCGVTFGGKLS